MKYKDEQKIVIIGCGNLAWHLAKHLIQQEHFSVRVYNHRANKNLADFKKLGCTTHSSLDKIIPDASAYFICVSDKHISSVSAKIHTTNPTALVAHTSGSTSINELIHLNPAVFYPLQSFSKEVAVNWKEIPVLTEAKHKSTIGQLKALAQLFSGKVIETTSAERLKIHLAAVLVNNFTNSLYTAADQYLQEEAQNKNIDFSLLLPLIRQTTQKLETLSPAKAQTGPAKRHDRKIIKEHVKLLKKHKSLKKIYQQFNELIDQQQNNHA